MISDEEELRRPKPQTPVESGDRETIDSAFAILEDNGGNNQVLPIEGETEAQRQFRVEMNRIRMLTEVLGSQVNENQRPGREVVRLNFDTPDIRARPHTTPRRSYPPPPSPPSHSANPRAPWSDPIIESELVRARRAASNFADDLESRNNSGRQLRNQIRATEWSPRPGRWEINEPDVSPVAPSPERHVRFRETARARIKKSKPIPPMRQNNINTWPLEDEPLWTSGGEEEEETQFRPRWLGDEEKELPKLIDSAWYNASMEQRQIMPQTRTGAAVLGQAGVTPRWKMMHLGQGYDQFRNMLIDRDQSVQNYLKGMQFGDEPDRPQPIDRAERNFPYPRAISTPLSQGARSFTPDSPEREERGQRSDHTYVNTNNKSVLEKIPSLLTMFPVRKKGHQMGEYITSLKEAGISEEVLDGDHMGMYLRLTGSITASKNQKISERATTFCLPGQDPDEGKIGRLVEQTWNKELSIREAMDIVKE